MIAIGLRIKSCVKKCQHQTMLPYVCVRTMFEPTNKYSSRRNISIQVVELRYGGLFIPLLLFCFFFRPSVVAPFCCVWTIASQHTKTKNTIQKKRLKENRKAIGKKEKKKKTAFKPYIDIDSDSNTTTTTDQITCYYLQWSMKIID